MYDLNQFCNIVAALRKKKGWTQTVFAEKLGISPQSVSKWECGIGYPDVTLFPTIAELLEVPIGVIFGEKIKIEEENTMDIQRITNEYNGNFDICNHIKIYLGNTCRVEWIEDYGETCRVQATGDPVFIRFFDVEQDGHTLCVDVRNPCSSGTRWEAYDREGYTGENLVRIYTPITEDNLCFETINFLDLAAENGTNEQGHYQVICSVMEN